MRTIVVASSPLVGPMTTLPTVDALRRLGHDAEQADLRRVATADDPGARALDVVMRSAGGRRPVLVAHSGASCLVPGVAAATQASAIVIVDGLVPPEAGTVRPADTDFRAFLAGLVDADGLLPPWSEWFGTDMLARLVADPTLRRLVAAELWRLPLAYFDRTIVVPNGWSDRPCAYVRLSARYEDEAAIAAERGWTVARIDGDHLWTATQPDAVARAILATAGMDLGAIGEEHR